MLGTIICMWPGIKHKVELRWMAGWRNGWMDPMRCDAMDSCRGWVVSRRRNFSPGFDLCHAIAHRSLVGVGFVDPWEGLVEWRSADHICCSTSALRLSNMFFFFYSRSGLPTLTPAYLASPDRLRNPIPNRNRKSLVDLAGDVCASTKINVDAFSITTLAAYKFGVKRNRS